MPNTRQKKMSISLIIPFAIIALVFGALIWKKMQDSREVRPVPEVNQPAAVRKAVLFFVADGSRLVREARELESCSDMNECVRDLLDELLSGPMGDLDIAIPENTAVNGLLLEGDMAVIDLNRSFATDLPSGSSAEMMAVYSLVDTICVNFPQIARVKLTIEGNQNSQLKHLDLSDPLLPDYTLEQESAPKRGADSAQPSISAVQKGKP